MPPKLTRLVTLTLILLAACAPTPTATPTPTLTPSQTASPTITPISSSTPNPTATPIQLSTGYTYVKHCVYIRPSIPDGLSLEGAIVTQGISKKQVERPVELLVLPENDIIPITVEGRDWAHSIYISPDKTKVGLETGKSGEDGQLLILDTTTDEKTSIAFESDWFGFGGWFNDNELIISLQGSGALILLNPITNERKELAQRFPDSFDPYFIDRQGMSMPVYNPDNNYVLYAATRDGSDGMALSNLSDDGFSMFFPFSHQINELSSQPVWSNDGQRFVFIGFPNFNSGSELFLGDLAGKVEQVTEFNQDGKDPIAIHRIAWSPDNKFIAFLLRTYNISTPMEKLMVLDVEQRSLLDFCIEASYSDWGYVYSTWPFPNWSPDSTKLLVQKQKTEDEVQTVLIDLTTLTAGVLFEGKKVPIGWLDYHP